MNFLSLRSSFGVGICGQRGVLLELLAMLLVLRLKNTSTESDLYKVNISFLEMLATKVASSSLAFLDYILDRGF